MFVKGPAHGILPVAARIVCSGVNGSLDHFNRLTCPDQEQQQGRFLVPAVVGDPEALRIIPRKVFFDEIGGYMKLPENKAEPALHDAGRTFGKKHQFPLIGKA